MLGIFTTLLGAGLTAAAGAAANSSNRRAQQEANETNIQIGKENREWQEKMQREQWARDDSAFQRMSTDMQNAGLNPLSGTSPVNSGLSASSTPATVNAFQEQPIPFDFSSVLNAIVADRNASLQNKALNIQAIKLGIDPSSLDDASSKNDVLDLYKRQVKAQVKELEKQADSPYVRGEGNIMRNIKDADGILGYIFGDYSNSSNSSKPKKSVFDRFKPKEPSSYIKKKNNIPEGNRFIKGTGIKSSRR